jgi:hypothetical protein
VLKSITKVNKQIMAGEYVQPDKKNKKAKKVIFWGFFFVFRV